MTSAIPSQVIQSLHNQRLPRYTSYPPASEFGELPTTTHEQWLTQLPHDEPISLYVHIPFCRELCWFCGCFTTITQHEAPIQRYVKMLLQEIHWLQKITGPLEVSHLHFGGGSPTILSANNFADIMQALHTGFRFLPHSELAIEIDPRTVDATKIAAYAQCGITRASLGVQDFNARVQHAVHREQPYELVADIVQRLRDHHIDNINFDLMYGLPYQTVESVTETAIQALTLCPNRLSVFGYAHVPWMRKHQQVLDSLPLPDLAARIQMSAAMKDIFVTHHYVPIGMDHYAQPQDELTLAMQQRRLKRNFQGYTTDQAETLLALGISAISSLPQGYIQNTSKLQHYKHAIDTSCSPALRGKAITVEDKARREIISELMCHYQVNLQKTIYKYRLNMALTTELEILQSFADQNLLTIIDSQLTLTPQGYPYVRAICAVFDQYLQPDKRRFSLAV